jgi:pyrrolysine biosynthesis protein PylC
MHPDAEQWVLQEYIQGPSYSIEVIGSPDNYHPLQVTDLEMDDMFDCKRVLAPSRLPAALVSEFEDLSVSLAAELGLNGLMDVEVMLAGQQLKVLEIDARLPSQTPTAVFWSTGANMVEMLGGLFVEENLQPLVCSTSEKHVIYEHIKVSTNGLESAGEHILSGADALHVECDFFGADEAITNFTRGRENWVATLIICESDRDIAWEKRDKVVEEIRQHFDINKYRDSSPDRIRY